MGHDSVENVEHFFCVFPVIPVDLFCGHVVMSTVYDEIAFQKVVLVNVVHFVFSGYRNGSIGSSNVVKKTACGAFAAWSAIKVNLVSKLP